MNDGAKGPQQSPPGTDAAYRELQDRLRAAERRFQVAFHQSPQPTAISRLADGVYTDVNQAYAEMTGYAREELIGRSLVELGVWTGEERAAIVAPLVAGNALHNREIPFRTRDGRRRRLVASSEPIDVDGVACALHVVTDVTERREAEEALRRSEAEARARAEELAAVLEATPAAVWIAADRECREIRGNRAGHEMLRTTVGANLSKTALDTMPSRHFRIFRGGVELEPHELPLQVAAREGVEVRQFEEEIRFDDGDVIHIFGNAVPLYAADGTPRGAIATFFDVTPLKKAEAALIEADRRKDEFIATLSHELRNPMAPILTAVHLMKLRGDEKTAHARGVIERQAQLLIALIDDLLDVSRIARGKIELHKERVEIASVVAKAVETTAPMLDRKRHRLHVAVPATGHVVDADEVRLAQVVSNLLTNAARYTPEAGEIAVSARREADDIVLRVRDNGVGIAPELLPRVFDMFVQGSRRSDRADGGLGLGLALTHSLVQLHGGTVTAHSDGAGCGSEFVVRLPAATD